MRLVYTMDLKETLSLSDTVIFLKRYGLWFNFSDSKFATLLKCLQIFRIIFIIILWPFSVIAIYIIGIKNCLDGTIYFSVIALMGVFQFIFFLKERNRLEIILVNFSKKFRDYDEIWKINIFMKHSKLAWKLIYNYRNMSASFVCVYLFLPIIIDTVRLAYFGNSVKLFRVPLPLLGLVGSDPVRGVSYYSVTLLSSLWAVDCIVSHIGTLGSLILFTFYIAIELQILRHRIKGLYLKKSDVPPEKALKSIIQEHQSLVETAQSLNQLFGFPLAVQNIAESLCLCLTLFSALYQYEKTKILLLANIASGSMNVILLFGTCFIGEFLQEQSTLLYEEICFIPWHDLNPSTRRDILMMIIQGGKFMKIDFKGKLTLNLQTFMQVINSAYSYFMMLNSSIS